MQKPFDRVRIDLNSTSRTSGSNEYCSFTLPKTVTRVGAFSVRHVEMPYSMYTFNAGNNVFLIVGGAITSITIAAGSYTGSALAALLQTAMRAGTITNATVTYSNYIFTFTATVNFTITANANSAILGISTTVTNTQSTTSQYNVYSPFQLTAANNTLSYTFAGNATVFTATISPGTYDAVLLSTTLQTLINAQVNPNTSTTAGITVIFNPNPFVFSAVCSTQVLTLKSTSACASLLGITSDVVVPIGAVDVDEVRFGLTAISIMGPNVMYIKSHTLTEPRVYKNYTNNVEDDTIHKVQMSDQFGAIVMENCVDPDIITFSNATSLSSIDLRLTDESNNIINLNGLPWSVTLLLYRY
jgi:hypothetical protein